MIAGWTAEHSRRAKEILYRCLEQVSATKSALYLLGGDGVFELVTSYGFGKRDALAASIEAGHPLWDWVRRHRTNPSFSNQVEDGALQNYLNEGQTTRLLTAPLLARDQLVGLIDARDKARRAPFVNEDVVAIRSISAALLELLAEDGLYGLEPEEPTPILQTPAATLREPTPDAPLHADVVAAGVQITRLVATIPDIAAAVMTITDGAVARTRCIAPTELDPDQRDAVIQHQSSALAAASLRVPPAAEWAWTDERVAAARSAPDTIHTTVLRGASSGSILLTVLCPEDSDVWLPVTAVAAQHLELASRLRDFRRATRNLARLLLEPGETSLPHLRQHSHAVSELAQRMAIALQLPSDDEELVTVAAYLHDVGMRELDYARIYRMPKPGDAEKRMYQRHPIVGARMVEDSAFPGDLAGAIRHHHERWDGGGYPQKLAGSVIPLASRIIHLAEVYDTLTSPSSYKPAVGREGALTIIRSEAGHQFDPDLVPVLEEVVGR